jgi:hypothetical protein
MTFEEIKKERYGLRPFDIIHNPNGFRQDHAGGSDISAHLPLIEYFASKCNHCTELGTRDGHSTIALIAGCKGKVISYDINLTPLLNELYGINLPCQWVFRQESSIAPENQIEETDLLFVDTLHSYNQVKEELRLWGAITQKYIIFHDTFSHGEYAHDCGSIEGINRAISEFLKNNKSWKSIYKVEFNHGLHILEKARC